MYTKIDASRIFDVHIDHQKLRHGKLAYLIRKFVYRLFIDKASWPLVFRAPQSGNIPRNSSSAHIYVHIPFCKTICPHCPYSKITYEKAVYEHYAKALINEIRGYLTNKNIKPIESLYFGGGTPTLGMHLVETAIQLFKPFFVETPEVAIEVHPADADERLLAGLQEAGITKISLGIETFNEELLKKLHRRYSPHSAKQAIQNARRLDFDCLDINLIYGIPGQNPGNAVDDAKKCIDLGVDQISAYPLFTFNHTALGNLIANRNPRTYGERAKMRVQKGISALCRQRGYLRTSVWSYTKKGVKPYTTVTRTSYRGFGAAAGSKIDGIFWFNTFSVDEYSKLHTNIPALVLNANERFRRFHWLYWQIYCTAINTEEYKRLFHRNVLRDFRLIFIILRVFGLAKKKGVIWYLSEFGVTISHALQSLFSLAYIETIWQVCQKEPWPQEITVA